MQVRVRFFGFLRSKFPEGSDEVNVSEGTKLHDLFLSLVDRYGEIFKDYVFDPAEVEVKKDILVNINDMPIRRMQGLGTELNDGDQVDVLPLFAGGG